MTFIRNPSWMGLPLFLRNRLEGFGRFVEVLESSFFLALLFGDPYLNPCHGQYAMNDVHCRA